MLNFTNRQNGTPGSSPGPSLLGMRPQAAGSAFSPPVRGGLNSSTGMSSEDGGISMQVAQWDAEMDNIDKKQEQLLNDQWKLLRTQIGSLMNALAEVKAEVKDLKENTLSREVEDTISNLLGAHEDHGQKHAGLLDRVTYLESFVGESADKHAQDLADAHGNHADHKLSMETRLEYIENKIGDNAEAHAKDFEAHAKELQSAKDALHKKLDDVHSRLSECAKSEHHATTEERVRFLEKYLGESVDKHDTHKTSMETRLEYIEGLIGDNADKHAGEINAAKDRVGSLEAAIKACAQHDHASSLEERMEYLESCLGESADRHDNHRANMEQRLEFIEGLMGDNADKHWTEIQNAHGKLGDLHDAIKSAAKASDHSELQQRIGWLEEFIGESAAVQAKEMADAKRNGGQFEKHQTVETRLEFIEAMIGDSADKHGKELDAHKGRLGELEDTIKKCAKMEHHHGVNERLDDLEKRQKHMHHELDATNKFVHNASGKIASEASRQDQKYGNVEDRLSVLERKVGDQSEDVLRKLSTLDACQCKLKNNYDELYMFSRSEASDKDFKLGRLDEETVRLDTLVQQGLERLTREQDDTKKRLRDVHAKAEQQQGVIHNNRMTVDQRLDSVEIMVSGASGAKMTELSKDVEQRLFYMQEDQKRARDVLEGTLQEQIRLEHSIHEDVVRQLREEWERELNTRTAYQEQYRDLLNQEREGRDRMQHAVEKRVGNLENAFGLETSRIWTAIDTHSHEDLTKEIIVQQPPPPQEFIVPQPLPPQEIILQSPRSFVAEPVRMVSTSGLGAPLSPRGSTVVTPQRQSRILPTMGTVNFATTRML